MTNKLFYRVRDIEHQITENALVPIEDCYADFETLEAAWRWYEFVTSQPNVASAEIIEIYRQV